ncbi:MAG TPA: N-acetylmuramoyl-L-alanine amidase [Verrucomicrobiae bacterium]|nr:N-acetylmuramoyl-L-alanine amidase [Verrucomicrobiae bacterium]
MLKPVYFPFCLLLALAGCVTKPSSPPPDWNGDAAESGVEIEHIAEGPQIAPPHDLQPQSALVRTNAHFANLWIPLDSWSRQNRVGTLTQISPAPQSAFSLTTSNGELLIAAGSLIAKWEGAEFRLGFAPQMVSDHLFIHALDLKKNIEPLLQPLGPLQKSNRTVVIDAGHGGSNAGTRSVIDGTNEKEFTLDWALRLQPLMETNGWQVWLTRTNDVEMSLSNRVAFAEEHQADLVISLHFNSAAPHYEQSGLETICLTPAGMHSTFTRGYEDNPALVFANNSFDAENLRYAMLLQRELLKECGFVDRGVRRARFLGVLRGQNRPAVLLEGGFLSNTNEARRIADPEFRQKLAESVARALK